MVGLASADFCVRPEWSDPGRADGLGTVFTRFDDPKTARQLVDCNRFSGKWNHHYFDGWTVETAINDLSVWLKKVLE
jgi:hypothetical protein